jgi:hypothetical protein
MFAKQVEITGSIFSRVNGRFEIYNISESTIHMARLNKAGTKMPPSAKSLVNMTKEQYQMGIDMGAIREI